MSTDQLFLYALIPIIACYLWPRLMPLRKDKELHYIPDNIKEAAQKHYEKVLSKNEGFKKNDLLQKYANLVKEEVHSVLMYFEGGQFPNVTEEYVIYWIRWSKHFMKKTKKMESKYDLVIVRFTPE